MITAYLQHGQAGEPMATEAVEAKESPLGFHLRGQTYTATGYGERIPTPYMVKVQCRWRRVYAFCISNAATLFIGRNLRTGIVVDLDHSRARAARYSSGV